jgi:hypothetical protein
MNHKLRNTAILGIILLSACGSVTSSTPTLDINAIYTAAAQTVIVELTQTASASSPTPEATATGSLPPPTTTPIITSTPQPQPTLLVGVSPTQVSCDNLSFDPLTVDVNIPDGTQMSPGQDFIKTWRIRNTGTCPWGAGYGLVFGYGTKMDGQPVAFTVTVNPGEEVEVSVHFKAPNNPGEYLSSWRVANAAGSPFGKFFYVKISVR